jgi:2-polyprenyl-3-methyl-5-hydroxy-6-metoxy-1,4-benzoquinol methylase
MRVLITGNLGYVRPFVTRHLRRRFPNADLIGFDAGYFAHCLTTTGMLPETLLSRQHFGDVRDLRPDLLRGTDAIVHLAAISNDTMGSQYAAATDSVNRGASLRLARLAANAGYLLQYFRQRGIKVLGVDPASNVAAAAVEKGIPTKVVFFGIATAQQLRERGIAPDLMVANNVLGHVPDINDFVCGLALLLKPEGVLTVEFPHLLRLMQETQFDTIYHEHVSYLSLHVVQRIFARHGLRVFDVQPLSTHGGSLRVFACHVSASRHTDTPAAARVLAEEVAAGLEDSDAYRHFARQVVEAKLSLPRFLIDARAQGKLVAAYGAPAKGNTLLNYCGIGPEPVAFIVDRNPHKQGMLLPGTRIPVRAPEALLAARPHYVLILAWNLQQEITTQMQAVRAWGGRFVVPIPTARVLP